MTETQKIIQELGGPTKIGDYFQIRPQAVCLWSLRNRIPVERVPALLRLAEERGVQCDLKKLRADVDWEAIKTHKKQ